MGVGFNEDRDLQRIITPDGTVPEGVSVPELSDEELLDMYRDMRTAREFDERAVRLQRQGRLGTYPPLRGQEATQIGSTYALDASDWIFYQYREHGAVIARDIGPEYLLYWKGYEEGNAWLAEKRIFPINIGIGSQVPHATGFAWGAKYADDREIVLCHFGDGATSEGDFHEGMNFASVFDVPCVFMCNNNQYAISVPRGRQTASATFAQKAKAYGIPGVRVDGMDPLAVYQVTREAVDRARSSASESRPTLVEAVHYRFGAHTTADDPSVYRAEAEVEAWKDKDPLVRFESFLRNTGRLDDERDAAVRSVVSERIDTLVDEAEAMAVREPDRMFEYVFEAMPERLQEQQAYLRDLRETYGDDSILDT